MCCQWPPCAVFSSVKYSKCLFYILLKCLKDPFLRSALNYRSGAPVAGHGFQANSLFVRPSYQQQLIFFRPFGRLGPFTEIQHIFEKKMESLLNKVSFVNKVNAG